MNDAVVVQAVAWLLDPANWQGQGGVGNRLWEHVYVSAVSTVLAAALALPLALWLGHLGRGGALASAVANLGRAVPTLAVLVLLALAPAPLGIGNPVTITVVALVLFGIPPVLTNAYAGVRGVDADVVEAARGMGLTGWQVLTRVEVPLAMPLVVAGLRIATSQIIATLTIAAFVVGPGLGRLIRAGLQTQDTPQFVAGAVLVALLALVVEVAFQLLQRRSARRSGRTRVPLTDTLTGGPASPAATAGAGA
jgi:osmoprotectant transport system permease protein